MVLLLTPTFPLTSRACVDLKSVPEGHLRIDLNCNECGSDSFCLDRPASDSSMISCDGCGHIMGTIGELKTELGRAILRRSTASSDNRDLPG